MSSAINLKKANNNYLSQLHQKNRSIKPNENLKSIENLKEIGSEAEPTENNQSAVNHITDQRRSEVEQRAVLRSSDNFYKIHDRGSRLFENGKAYVIEAYAPETERNNVRVSIHQDKAVISGHRQFADKMQKGSKLTSTNNYQTFREEFNFNTPVESQGMTRERSGDFIRYVIPKKTEPDDDQKV